MSLLNLLPIALLAASRHGTLSSEPDIAGWVRFGDARAAVELCPKGQNHGPTLRGEAMMGARLYGGESVLAKGHGQIALSVYGFTKTIAAGSKRYVVPSVQGKPVGSDLQKGYLMRGGSEGGRDDLRWLWLADTFENLASRGRHDLNIDARIVTGAKRWMFQPIRMQSIPANQELRMSEKSSIDVKTDQTGTMYVYFFDADGSGKVSRFYRNFTMIHSGGWIRSPLPVWWDLPSPKLEQAQETEYVIASATPIDMARFDHPELPDRGDNTVSPGDDSPITSIFGPKNSNCRKWTILSCRFLLKRR